MKRILPVLLMLSANALWAQSGELWFSAGASIVSYKGGSGQLGSPFQDGDPGDVRIGNGYRFGFRFALNSSGHFGHELQYAYNRTDLTDVTGAVLGDPGSAGMAIHQGGYNLVYYFRSMKEEQKVRPFVTGGVHLNDAVLPGSAALTRTSIKPGFNFGAGIKLRITTLFGFRLDLRQYETRKPNWGGVLFNQGNLLHQTEASAGIGIHF